MYGPTSPTSMGGISIVRPIQILAICPEELKSQNKSMKEEKLIKQSNGYMPTMLVRLGTKRGGEYASLSNPDKGRAVNHRKINTGN